MGADKPNEERTAVEAGTPFPLIPIAAFLLIAFVALILNDGFEGGQKTPALKPKEQTRLETRLREIDDSEQYALVAAVDGYYPCIHSGKTTVYLYAGEVWKYGVTSKGKFGRYSEAFLFGNKVSYIIEFKGTFSECLKEEQVKLYHYPNLPENLARPIGERLPRPPYNSIMR